jgi:putative ABC transport system permease protein
MRLLNTRWKKVIRDLWGNKSRTALVVMAIAVGVFAIGVVSGSRETIETVLNESYMSTNPPSGTLRLMDTFDDKMVETIDSLREVEVAEGRTELTLRYKVTPEDEWQNLEILVADNFEDSEICKNLRRNRRMAAPG